MNGPAVTVIIPVHNGERFLGEAIASALDQRYQPVEVIVVDDASTDASHHIAASFAAVTAIRLPVQKGPAAARNAGLAVATGKYVAFLDADDVMSPDRLAVQIAHLGSHPHVGAVLVSQEIDVEPGVEPPGWLLANPQHLDEGGYLPISVLVATDLLRKLGGFDPSYLMSEDMELLFRLHKAGVVVEKLDDVLVRRRIHGANLTYNARPMERDLLRAVRAILTNGRS
ncbi:MAG: glycosyltransferase [Actinomycetota bacterium]|nr:glycosyltransferase [Actinomycetota bacterium]